MDSAEVGLLTLTVAVHGLEAGVAASSAASVNMATRPLPRGNRKHGPADHTAPWLKVPWNLSCSKKS